MENNIFDKAGKQLPYVMPEGFDVTQLMQTAISKEKSRRRPVRLALWLGSSAAVAAVALLVLFVKPTLAPASDPTSAYRDALTQYCNNASEAEMQKRINMQEADYMANMEHYEAYYN